MEYRSTGTCSRCKAGSKECQCYPMMQCRVQEKGYNLIGSEGVAKPSVRVDYGPVEPSIASGLPVSHCGEFSSFDTLETANGFAEFLNSDAIFECQIPSRFLKPEPAE